MSGHWPWSQIKRRLKRQRQPEPWEGHTEFTFSGVFYAENNAEEEAIVDAIANAVCPNGGGFVSTPTREDEGDSP